MSLTVFSLVPATLSPAAASTKKVSTQSAPVITALSAVAGTTTAKVTWSTNERATSQVQYGLSGTLTSASPLSTTLTTSHSVTLSGLASGTTYTYRAVSKDRHGNAGYSAKLTFATAAATTTAPTTAPTTETTTETTTAPTTETTTETTTAPTTETTTELTATPTTETCSSITQHGVTFTFDAAYPCGTFVNGDHWVTGQSVGGPVSVTAISPVATSTSHGWAVNPSSNSNHAYDSRVSGFKADLMPALPYAAGAGQSIVKTVSNANACGGSAGHAPCVQTAVVLTVLAAAPADNGATVFRPPYFGTHKPLISTSAIRTDLLPALPAVSGGPSLEFVRARYAKVQLDHRSSWTGRYLHPVDSFIRPGSTKVANYGADLARDNNDAVLRLMHSDSVDAKMPALVNVLQAGIDWYGASKGGVTYHPDGGHNVGRKIMVTFAGVLLDNADIKAVAGNAANAAYSENGHVYYSPATGQALFGKPCADGMYDQVRLGGSGSRDCRDPHGQIDGGEVPGSTYQFCCTSKAYKASSLAARLLPGGRAVWNADHFHQYADRWVTGGAWTSSDTYGRTFDVSGTWVTSASLHGTNRDGGHYGSTLQDNMWSAYRGTVQ